MCNTSPFFDLLEQFSTFLFTPICSFFLSQLTSDKTESTTTKAKRSVGRFFMMFSLLCFKMADLERKNLGQATTTTRLSGSFSLVLYSILHVLFLLFWQLFERESPYPSTRRKFAKKPAIHIQTPPKLCIFKIQSFFIKKLRPGPGSFWDSFATKSF